VSNTNDYIITTLSSGSNEYTNLSDVQVQAPFSLGSPSAINLRQTGAPYVVTQGIPSTLFTRQIIAAGGGGGGVTAQANLAHWWKMNEGSTTSATDYGNATTTGTNFTMSGVTSTAGGGPSAIGSPASISTDGVNDVINTKLSNGATKTVVGDLFDNASGISVCMWLKIPAAVGTYDTFWFAGNQVYPLANNGGAGMFFRDASPDTLWTWFEAENYTSPPTYSYNDIGYDDTVGTDWVHWAYTFPASGVPKVYINGALVHSYASFDPVNTEINPNSKDSWLSLGVVTRATGGAPGTPAYNYYAAAHFSDVRLYDKELISSEVAAIAAGDWT
jgi:hypothetical protein